MSNPNGRFGIHGGQYIPETLMNAVIELEEAYNRYKVDPEFQRELAELLEEYGGRPSRLYYAKKMKYVGNESKPLIRAMFLISLSPMTQSQKSLMMSSLYLLSMQMMLS